jgi:hypothetical protein
VWSILVRARLLACLYSCLSHGVVGKVWQQAADCIAASESRRLGVTVTSKDFKKKGKVVQPRIYSMERFQILLPIFDKGLPADLSSAVEHADSSSLMYRSEPALKHLSLICKYGPFKACLLEAWQYHKGQQPSRGLLLPQCGPLTIRNDNLHLPSRLREETPSEVDMDKLLGLIPKAYPHPSHTRVVLLVGDVAYVAFVGCVCRQAAPSLLVV